MQEVEPSELGHRGGDESGDAVVVGDVELGGDGRAAVRPDRAGDRLRVRPDDVTDHHGRALLGEPSGRGGADTRTAARHHDDLAVETSHRSQLPPTAGRDQKPCRVWHPCRVGQ